ncbi:MAG: sugar transferase [Clostridia bacterium]
MKNYEQYKRLFRLLLVAVLFAAEMFMYKYVWIEYYSELMEISYARLGHWMMVAVYGVVLCVFTAIFGGLKIGYLRNFNMIYAQSLISICANIMIYLQIVLLTKHFYTILPLLLMTLAEIVVISFWSPLSLFLYRKIYPPRHVLLVYGERWTNSLMEKFNTRSDCFYVSKRIHISEGLDKIYAKAHDYEGVIICDVPSDIRNKILKYCYDCSIRTYTTPKISDIIVRSSEDIHLFDTPLLLSRNSGLTVEQRVVKRFFDILISFVSIIVLSPLMGIIALAIKLDDKGPVLFKQDRCTKDGKIFAILKFRSMIVDAEKEGAAIPAIDNDPRITRVGKVLRKIRVDELPQLFNILKGDMSIIGPRPERIEHVQKYTEAIPEFKYREKVKAGLTGYAQVYGKYNTTPYDKLKLDLMYIQNYSILLDLEILCKTIKTLFEKESTEGFAEDGEPDGKSAKKHASEEDDGNKGA